MDYISSIIAFLLGVDGQHFYCRWESATLFSLILGGLCYFGRYCCFIPVFLDLIFQVKSLHLQYPYDNLNHLGPHLKIKLKNIGTRSLRKGETLQKIQSC